MNIVEKYLARAAGLAQVSPGQDIRCKVDLVIAHDVTGPMAAQQFEKIGIDKVFDPNKVVIVVDHIYPAATVQARKMQLIVKDFAKKYGVTLYDKGQGVIHQVISENHGQKPGALIIGADSHTCTAGGYGALGIGVGSTELAAAMATGTIDLEVPEVVEVYLTGSLAAFVTAKDLILTLIRHFGTDGLTDKAVIFSGPGIADLSKDERMTICNMGIEMGATISCFATEEKAVNVSETLTVELANIVPSAACPFSPGNVKPVKEIEGIAVTQVVVGSCTNGRLSDMEQVVSILKNHNVHADVNMLVVPASQNVYDAMEERGYCKIIRNAGAALISPGCGPCFGAHLGLAAEDDVVVSTTNRNFPGRMGSRQAQVYLASPLTAALAAVHGRLVDPQGIQSWEVK